MNNQIWNQVRDRAWNQVGWQVSVASLEAGRGSSPGRRVMNLNSRIAGRIYNQVWHQVRTQVHDQVGFQVYNQVWGSSRGVKS